ncbi:endonuclease/exonuclease/phosphatase family protein [Longimicrobium terrae]|uniref:Endonuclease/exonuclease/phosphatase family metal-dependent hydrolase n=1 Tax=Longimicrobium terrae TaxID=1639882 RepID=A0A841H0V6_9BACT|nr:endonuclease/exonuclease/phosphatase family protein [Longimicrobium terrae]MBB4637155.1 endonuclease/exonuclease/phosphatase family metal-dependent hydrolase [Longimicrobium terrae]MBB6071584.1 endonuclease/exonuclease/phosphatase family metal-dependent hydrolase [Longimicrobium terrae]NNC29997.1 endonuclease/exonuclease/phosphatase family protein [Longimicrobium terrae]
MTRIHRSMVIRTAAASVLLAMAFAASARAQSAAPVVLDGAFDEWSGIPAAVMDAADAPAPFADMREVRVRDDAEGVYLLLDLERPIALQSLPGTLQVLLDTDGDTASGWTEMEMRGVDAVLAFSPRAPNGGLSGTMLRIIRRAGGAPEEIPAVDAGVLMAPSVGSRRFEVRLGRGAPFRFGGRLRARIVARDRTDSVIDQTVIFSAPLSPGAHRPTPRGHGDADPLARAPGTDFRLLSWNVGRDDLFEGTVEFGALLRAVQPDVVILDEVDTDSAEKVLIILNRILPGDRPWRGVLGRSGGTQRGVVAVRAPVSVATPFAGHVAYPDSAAALVPRDAAASAHAAAARRASEGVPTVGAVAEMGGRRLLAVTVDLECCGDPGSPSDRLRRVEAAVLRDGIREALRGGGVDAVIVAGDFNLVGSRTPLELLAAGTDVDGSALVIAEPRRLNGASMATWEKPGDRFTPGRLDYVLVGDAALTILQSFPLNSGDLSRTWRAHHGLDAETSHRATDHLPVITDLRWTGG